MLFAVVIICGFEVHEECRAHGGGLGVLGLLYTFARGCGVDMLPLYGLGEWL